MSRLGPDERTYMHHARAEGASGFGWRECIELQARAYVLNRARERDYPSPIRWGWALCLRVHERAAIFFAAMCAGLTFCASPLLIHLARLRLQDTAVAALTIACVVAAHERSPMLAIGVFGLFALKPEGALLAMPAIWFAGWGWNTSASVYVGAFAWASVTAWIFRGHAWPLVRALWQPHANAYGLEHQRGLPHRLLVDLALVSPVWLFACVAIPAANHAWQAQAAALLVVAHACTPVRNVRTILAADLLMRAAVLHAAPWYVIALGAVVDFFVVCRMWRAGLYDTPTAELVRATCKGPTA